MPKYNRSFDLTIADVDLIETALQQKLERISSSRLAALASNTPDDEEITWLTGRLAEINELMGRLHNQKTFYRPNSKSAHYISG